VLAALLWLCGLLSKEIAATLPIVLAVDDWLARREFADRVRTIRMLLVRYVPLGVAAIIYLLLRENAVTGGSQIWPGFADVSTSARILTASRVMMEYIGLFLFPTPLLADYWISEVPVAHSLLNPAVFASLVLWVLTAVAIVRAKGDARIILPVAWFFLTLAPVSNFFFPIGVAKAERLLYLPSVGLCLLAGTLATALTRRATARIPGRVVFGVAVVAFLILTVRRNQDWKDNLTLAQATLAVSPESPLMNDVAAGELMKLGQPQLALTLLQEATRQAPQLSFLHAHLGAVYAALGMRVESEAAYLTALRLNPRDASAHNNLAVLYQDASRDDLALERLRNAIAIRPDFADAHSNLGTLYLGQGKLAEAATELAEAVRLNPMSADARNNYGLVLARLGRRDKAAEQYREALRLDPNHAKARSNLSALEKSRNP
jgi:Flp pilus assembly protein TadD